MHPDYVESMAPTVGCTACGLHSEGYYCTGSSQCIKPPKTRVPTEADVQAYYEQQKAMEKE